MLVTRRISAAANAACLRALVAGQQLLGGRRGSSPLLESAYGAAIMMAAAALVLGTLAAVFRGEINDVTCAVANTAVPGDTCS